MILPVFAASLVLSAQSTLGTGAIGGIVRDESNLSIAGVKIVLTETSKGLSRKSETNNSGSFFFPSVITGVYRLEAEKDGFKIYEIEGLKIEGLKIEVGEVESIPVTLVIGDARTVVAIQAPSSTELDSNSNTMGSVIDSKRIQDLPLDGREFLQLALLVGGALDLSPANNLSSANVGPPSRAVVLPGTFPHSTGYSLNGINLNGSRDGESASGPQPRCEDHRRQGICKNIADQALCGAARNPLGMNKRDQGGVNSSTVLASLSIGGYTLGPTCIIGWRRRRPFARMKCHALCESRGIVTRLKPSPL